jgi:hypothetical protein
MITFEKAHELFEYLPDGTLRRKVTTSNRSKAGTIVGYERYDGYSVVYYNKFWYRIHRLVYFMHTGEWPEEVDHIDGNPKNNRIENLRACTHKQNLRNTGNFSHNTSGVKGVTWQEDRKKWYAYITIDGKMKSLGRHDDFETAAKLATEARKEAYGEFFKETT